MTKNRLGKAQLVLTLLVLMLLFVIPLLFSELTDGVKWGHMYKIWREYSILLVILLLNRYLLMPKLFLKGKRTLYFIVILSLIGAAALFVYKFDKSNNNMRPTSDFPPHRPPMEERSFMPPHLAEESSPDGVAQGKPDRGRPQKNGMPRELVPPYANLLVIGILLIGFDSGLLFFSKWVHSEQNKLNAEKESIKNKMAFLKNQISPHFFMNTLNNIHALVDIDTEEAKDSIIRLSQMMDYMLYESQSSQVSMKQEIDFIKSYVELMKLRITDEVELVLDIPEILPKVKLPPLLTISFIENAFKYGISYEAPSFIHIKIDVSETRFAFHVINSNHPKSDSRKNSGIGIENARKRLDLIYQNTYSLNIQDNEKEFDVNLNFPI